LSSCKRCNLTARVKPICHTIRLKSAVVGKGKSPDYWKTWACEPRPNVWSWQSQ
jgi:hypothetical protein